jgi:hypothetical protein
MEPLVPPGGDAASIAELKLTFQRFLDAEVRRAAAVLPSGERRDQARCGLAFVLAERATARRAALPAWRWHHVDCITGFPLLPRAAPRGNVPSTPSTACQPFPLRPQNVDSHYHGRVKAMMDAKQSRLIVNLGHLRDFDVALTRRLLESPLELVPVLESAVKDVSTARVALVWSPAVRGGGRGAV